VIKINKQFSKFLYVPKLLLFLASLLLVLSVQAQDYTFVQCDSLAQLALKQGNYNETFKWLRKGVKLCEPITHESLQRHTPAYQAYKSLHLTAANLLKHDYSNPKAAIPYYKEVIDLEVTHQNLSAPNFSSNLDALIGCYIQTQQFGPALTYIQQMLVFFDYQISQNTNAPDQIYTINNQKSLYLKQAVTICFRYQFNNQLLFFLKEQKKVQVALQQQQSSDHIYTLAYIAQWYIQNGHLPKAYEYINEAQNIGLNNKNLYNSFGMVFLFNVFGEYYRMSGERSHAIYVYKEAIRISKLLGIQEQNMAGIYSNLGRIYTDNGNFEKADSLFDKTLKIYARTIGTKNPNYTSVQTMKINNYMNKLHLKLLKKGPIAYNELHNASIEESCKRFLATRKEQFGSEHPDYASALVLLMNLYQLQERYEAAVQHGKKALAIREKSFGLQHTDYMALLFGYTTNLELSGDIDKAIQMFTLSNQLTLRYLRSSFANMTEFQRKKLLKEISYRIISFYSFAHRHIEQYPELAKEVVNASIAIKGLSLESNVNIRTKVLQSNNDSLIQLYNQWLETRTLLSKVRNMTVAQRQQKNLSMHAVGRKAFLLGLQLAKASSSLQSSFSSTQKQDYQALKAQLKTGEACIDFIDFKYYTGRRWEEKHYYYAAIIRPEDEYPVLIQLGSDKDINKLLNTEVSSSSPNYINDKVEGEYLYDLIWMPLESYLYDTKTIYLSPSGALNKVAFNALLTDYTSEKRLIEKHEMHYLSSLRDFFKLKQTQKQHNNKRKVALVGGVDFNHNSKDSTPTIIDSTALQQMKGVKRAHTGAFNYLLGTEYEINHIESLFDKKAWDIDKLKGVNASEEHIKQHTGDKAPKILHIASHGFFFDQGFKGPKCSCMLGKIGQQEALYRSGIALSGANKTWIGNDTLASPHQEDGILTAYEVTNLDLSQTDLVVLSACETGRGDINNTEGVMGLQRAFKLSGVKNMILSLWKVPDQQTAELMQLFYKNYLNKQSIHQAFRNAQLTMSKRYDNPYYWAAFVLLE